MSIFSPIDMSNLPATAGFAGPRTNAADNADIQNSKSFASTLADAFDSLNSLQVNSSNLTQAYATGQTSDLQSVMVASEQASIALQLATQVRNKVVDAYQEVMKITM